MKNVLSCEWRKLAFANYLVPPEVVEKYLPPYTKIDFYNGSCFVSLVGFQFRNVKIKGIQVPSYSDFEEINLRFYVKRFDGTRWRKGTVFISEIADKKALALLANVLMREHYQTLETSHEILEMAESLSVQYSWKYRDSTQLLRVISEKLPSPYLPNSETQHILHRLYGYGKVAPNRTNEYNIDHASWQTYPVNEYTVDVDFARVFGAEFSMLSSLTPHSVMLAEGSAVTIKGAQVITS